MDLKKKIRLKYNIIIGLFAAIFIFSSAFVIYYHIDSNKTKQAIEVLRNQIDRSDEEESTDSSKLDSQTIAKKLASYQKLYEQNNDMVGWIYIEGTAVDFPVMQTPTVKDYYLYKNFNEEYSVGGLPYAQEECDVFTPSDNVIIHGHHRSDGTMFAPLLNYKDIDYYTEHPIIEFDTLYECHTYQIIAVFTVKVNTGNDEFRYYDFIDAANASEFNAYVSECLARSYYDTGVTASYGDKLLTISTCDFTISNGRFVVVAKRIS